MLFYLILVLKFNDDNQIFHHTILSNQDVELKSKHHYTTTLLAIQYLAMGPMYLNGVKFLQFCKNHHFNIVKYRDFKNEFSLRLFIFLEFNYV